MIIKKKNIAAKAVSIGIAAMMTSSMITPTFAASYKWPLGNYKGKITRKFGKNGHIGTDLSGRGINKRKVYSIASGRVISTGFAGGSGRYVRIKNKDGKIIRYAHLSKIATKKGKIVKRGTCIGRVGSTGQSTGPHLHIDMQKKKGKGKKAEYVCVDPMKYLTQPR